MDTANYPPIVVTGPQRSGTTIASQILASDLDRRAIDECEFNIGADYTNCVLQLPQALDHLILLQHVYPGVQFLFVRRDPLEIIRSMKRIHWCKDDVHDWDVFLERYVVSRILLWNHIKQQAPEVCSEIDYKALSDHPLFVDKTKRKEFTSKQWEQGKPVGPKYWSNNTKCIQSYYAKT